MQPRNLRSNEPEQLAYERPELKRSFGQELLEPTRIYSSAVMEMINTGVDLKGMAHITSGGFGNLNRVDNDNLRFVIDPLPEITPVFQLIQDWGEISDREMYEVFNMGVGFCVVVEDTRAVEAVQAICKKHDIPSEVIGQVEPHQGKDVLIPEKNLKAIDQTFSSI